MKNIIIALTNKKSFLGYSNSITSMVADIPDEKYIFDVNTFDKALFDGIIKHAAAEQKTVKLLSSMAFGTSFIKEITTANDNLSQKEKNIISTILTGDRFYDKDIKGIKSLTLIMPKNALAAYVKQYPQEHFNKKSADLVASISAKEINQRADDFAKLNPLNAEKITSLLRGEGTGSFFVGGRVALPDGSFIENDPDIFKKAAEDFLTEVHSGVVVFHGLRSFTKGDGSNDFTSVEAFYNGVKKNIKEGATFLFLTKKPDEAGKRTSYLKEITKTGGEVKEQDYAIKESALGAAEYYWLLRETSRQKLPLKATEEQMNFIPEALELGNSPDRFLPYKWVLEVETNAQAYQSLVTEYATAGKTPQNAKQAFEIMIKNDTTNRFVLSKGIFR